jgi:hypothetical protein
MLKEHFFVNLMMLLQLGAILNYIAQERWILVMYWIMCLLINLVVTYGIKK